MELLFVDLSEFKGELAALGAAALWALASVVYALLGQKISPLKLNISKGTVGIILIGLTLVASSQSLPSLNPIPVILLLLSGAIAIGIGDTAYLTTLNYLGARRTLLMETLAPPLTAILAFFFLQETLTFKVSYGIILILLGVTWVISERSSMIAISRANLQRGVSWGLIAALCQAIGTVMSRFALLESGMSPLWSSLLRLVGGVLMALLLLIPFGQEKATSHLSWSLRLIGIITLTAFGSTYLGIWLQQTSLKYAPAGIAQTLLGTSPLFVLPLAVWMGDKISFRTILGVSIAITGIWFLF